MESIMSMNTSEPKSFPDIPNRNENKKDKMNLRELTNKFNINLRKTKINEYMSSKRKMKLDRINYENPLVPYDIKLLADELIKGLQENFTSYDPDNVLGKIFYCVQKMEVKDALYLLEKNFIFIAKNLLLYHIGSPDVALSILINVFNYEKAEIQQYADGILEREYSDILYNLFITTEDEVIQTDILWLFGNIFSFRIDLILPFIRNEQRFYNEIIKIIHPDKVRINSEIAENSIRLLYKFTLIKYDDNFTDDIKNLFRSFIEVFKIYFDLAKEQIDIKLYTVNGLANILKFGEKSSHFLTTDLEEIPNDFILKLIDFNAYKETNLDHQFLSLLSNLAELFEGIFLNAPISRINALYDPLIFNFIFNSYFKMQEEGSNLDANLKKEIIQVKSKLFSLVILFIQFYETYAERFIKSKLLF